MKKVAIIIVTYNGAEYIGDCLSSLKKMEYPADSVKIIIVDNASTDNTADLIKKLITNYYLPITAIKNNQNLGFTGGNNVGLRYAIEHGFDYAYLLNQDTEVEPNFLSEAVRIAESDDQIGAVQSRLMLFNKKDTINSVGNQIHYLGFAFAGGHGTKITNYQPVPHSFSRGGLPITNYEIVYPSGAAVLIKVESLKKVGLLYDEYYMYHEDVDLGWQFWLSGFKCVLAAESVVYHKYEFSRSIKKYYFMERNRYLVILQNYKLATFILFVPAFCLMDIAIFFYSFIGGWWRELFKVYLYFLKPKNWQKLFARRKLVQSRRVVPDKFIISRFVGKIEFQDLKNPLLNYIANPILDLYWQLVKKIVWW